ncbi:sensor histidine kinase [Variovorax ginsengisoli]|uniref:PAS domain-containing sensor histidine kinase n=1 Tax=Variovorax ginsengisoli TaxID=363844 RepID=A0ABT8RY42_9BURK|nr:PAS domain-containing sensor histidine kinase [Variovorax ginsengisoli]MDN8612414.1 PAS domain-containing sensor histidine kinase [Variovorax ginsengisoli]MDO1531584.1 PAS domain-containing sensor histidine kinase [Variovorax ginsengisoli]
METPVLPAPASHPLWQHQLGLLLESTGEGIFGIDLDGHCMFINRAGAQMLGHERTEVLGRNMHELTHHSHPDGSHYADTDCPIFNAFRRGLACRIDTEVFWRRDGSAFAVEYSSHPILDGGQVRGAVITFVDITERRRSAQALQQAKDELGLRVEERTRALSDALAQLRELSAWLDKVREDERTRIAREVHDELGSLLVALKMDVDWIGKRLGEQQERAPDDAQQMRTLMRSKCRNMSGLIERAVDNVGRIITDLRPSILDHQGLWAALEWQAHEFVQSAELALDWQMDVAPGVELPEPAAIAVFRIFQEMLSNVGRHARASRLDIRIEAVAGQLHIRVRDDGIGGPAHVFEAPTAYGVQGMRERALHFGGRVQIRSEPGAGSVFSLELPLP